jgi:hypothetical protein
MVSSRKGIYLSDAKDLIAQVLPHHELFILRNVRDEWQ